MYAGDDRTKEKEDHRYNSDAFDIVIAHEFGYVLGIKDGYNDSKTETIDSIMCDQFGNKNDIPQADRMATGVDIQKALDANKKISGNIGATNKDWRSRYFKKQRENDKNIYYIIHSYTFIFLDFIHIS
jgi:hypothetical protein